MNFTDAEDNTPLNLCKRCQAVITQLRQHELSQPPELCAGCLEERFHQMRYHGSQHDPEAAQEDTSDASLESPHLCPTRSRPDQLLCVDQVPIACYNPVNKISIHIDTSTVGEDSSISENEPGEAPERTKSRELRHPVLRNQTPVDHVESQVEPEYMALQIIDSPRPYEVGPDPEAEQMHRRSQSPVVERRRRSNTSATLNLHEPVYRRVSVEQQAPPKSDHAEVRVEVNEEVPTEVVFQRRKSASRHMSSTEGMLQDNPHLNQGRPRFDERIIEAVESPESSDENLERTQEIPKKELQISGKEDNESIKLKEDGKSSKSIISDEDVSMIKKFKLFGLNTMRRIPIFKKENDISESDLDGDDVDEKKGIKVVASKTATKSLEDIEKIPEVEEVHVVDATTSKGGALPKGFSKLIRDPPLSMKDAVDKAVEEAGPSRPTIPFSGPPVKGKSRKTRGQNDAEETQPTATKKKGFFGKLFSAGGHLLKKS